jgi:hypothetical protein
VQGKAVEFGTDASGNFSVYLDPGRYTVRSNVNTALQGEIDSYPQPVQQDIHLQRKWGKPMPDAQATSTPGKGRLLDWLDAIAKLIGALAVVVVAYSANSFQSKVTGISIQSQREQAESQLRASMFASLITPIGGSQKDGKPIPADREQLLAELLALNFHENFELKPLMEDASERLVAEAHSKQESLPDAPDVREPLWSTARRIAERQKASIGWEWSIYESSGSLLRVLSRNSAHPD